MHKAIRLGKGAAFASLIFFIALIISIASFSLISSALPVGPTVTYTRNETQTPASAAMLNTSGGSITTMGLNTTAQNIRWKAYVGNVSGALTLDDASSNSIFAWDISSVTGEVYATRSPNTIQWSRVNCTWSYSSNPNSRATEEYENLLLNHSNPDDNLTATFRTRDHDPFFVGTTLLAADTCYSIHTFVNDSSQSQFFEEVLLYDGTNSTNGSVIYSALLEQNVSGFDGEQYDFQMIVPENGASTWSSSTAYYFYVELV